MRNDKDIVSDQEVTAIIEKTERRYQTLKTAERILELRKEIFVYKTQMDHLRRLGFFDINIKKEFDSKIKEVTCLMKSSGFSTDYSNLLGDSNETPAP